MKCFEVSKESNIWNFLRAYFEKSHGAVNWFLQFTFKDAIYNFFPIGDLIRKPEDSADFETSHDNLLQENNFQLIPIFLNSKIIFKICFYGTLSEFEAGLIKTFVELLVEKEAQDIRKYPSFLPVFLPLGEQDIDKINNALQTRENFFFLNGLSGTGKSTFIQKYFSYHYGVEIREEYFLKAKLENFIEFQIEEIEVFTIIVHELAYLSEEEQRKVLLYLENPLHYHVFVLSAYDPRELAKNSVIGQGLEEVCLKHRVIFPSLARRKDYIKETLEIYLMLKGIDWPSFFNEKFFKRHIGISGFSDFLNGLNRFNRPEFSLIGSFNDNKKIRDLVSEIEVKGIEFGQWIIGNSQNKIARFIGMSRGSLQHKLKKYKYPYNDWEE